jgi:hypothetical protein
MTKITREYKIIANIQRSRDRRKIRKMLTFAPVGHSSTNRAAAGGHYVQLRVKREIPTGTEKEKRVSGDE